MKNELSFAPVAVSMIAKELNCICGHTCLPLRDEEKSEDNDCEETGGLFRGG